MARGGVKITLLGDADSVRRATRSAESALDRLNRHGSRAMKGLATAAKGGALALGVGLVAAAKIGFDELMEGEKVSAQTAAALRSTGSAAKVTQKQIEDLAGAISRKTGIDDEAIQTGQNLLLTFTNLKDEAGKGNDIFTQTTRVMTDMSVALGTDAKGSAIQLGKALNDPIKGISALTRVGVTFTQGQKDQIKALVESGDTLGAQKVILAELNKEFGGSAEAFGKTLPGQIAKAKTAFSNFAGDLVGRAVPAVSAVGDAVGSVLDRFSDLREGGASVGGAIGTIIREAFGKIDFGEVASKMGEALAVAFNTTASIGSGIADGIREAVGQINGREVLSGLVRILAEAIDALFSLSWWMENFTKVLAVLSIAIPVAKIFKIPGAKQIADWILKPFQGAIVHLTGVIGGLMGRLGRAGMTALADGFVAVAARLPAAVQKVVALGWTAAAKLAGGLKKAGSAAALAMVVAVGTGLRALGETIGGAVRDAFNAVTGMGEWLASRASSWGRSIVSGIVSGIKSLPGAIGSAVLSIIPGPVRKIIGKVGGALGGLLPGGQTGGVVGALRRPPGGKDDMIIAARSDEVLLTSEQVGRVDSGQTVKQALAATGGVLGGRSFATGGVVGGKPGLDAVTGPVTRAAAALAALAANLIQTARIPGILRGGRGTPAAVGDVSGALGALGRDDSLQDKRARAGGTAMAERQGITNPDKIAAEGERAVLGARIADNRTAAGIVAGGLKRVRAAIDKAQGQKALAFTRLQKMPKRTKAAVRQAQLDRIAAINDRLNDLRGTEQGLIDQAADLMAEANELGYDLGALAAEITNMPNAPPPEDVAADAGTTGTGGTEATGGAADILTAQLAQANAKAASSARFAGFSESALRAFTGTGDIGSGGGNAFGAATVVNVNVNGSLVHQGELASYVVGALGSQGYRPASAFAVGA